MKALIRFPFFLLLSLLITVSFSCSKSANSSGTQYQVSAKINGTEQKITGYTVATFADLPAVGFKTCNIQGSASATSGSNVFSLAIIDVNAITTKQYTAIDIGGVIQATINYTDQNGVVYSSSYNSLADAVITISGLNTTDVAGTFSGTLSNVAGTSSITITDGTFVVKRSY
jgi:hypothetical protein